MGLPHERSHHRILLIAEFGGTELIEFRENRFGKTQLSMKFSLDIKGRP